MLGVGQELIIGREPVRFVLNNASRLTWFAVVVYPESYVVADGPGCRTTSCRFLCSVCMCCHLIASTTLGHRSFPDHSIRIKQTAFECGLYARRVYPSAWSFFPTSLLPRAYTGYVNSKARYLFHFFESRNDPQGRRGYFLNQCR